MDNKILKGAVVLLLLSTLFFGFQYFSNQTELRRLEAAVNEQEVSEQVVAFIRLFVEKVLSAEGEVDFETRLKLETAVRDLDNEPILNNWQKFINSGTQAEAQENVKEFLEVLVGEI